jgi:hypothetical protein
MGFTCCNNRERNSDRISYSDTRSLVPLSGVSYFDKRECVLIFAYDTKEKEHQNTQQSDFFLGATPTHTNQIASCFVALSST